MWYLEGFKLRTNLKPCPVRTIFFILTENWSLQAGVTQPPWLHQFHLGWTQLHPNYWIYCKHWSWVKSLFFPSFISRLPIKKIYSTTQAFQTPTTYLPPSKTLNLVVTQEQKQCSRRWCYRSNGEVPLYKTMLRKRVEAMLQKWCWSSVIKDVAKVVLQKMLLQKKLVHLWHVNVHQPFFLFASFSLLFFCSDVVDDGEPTWFIIVFYT
jgi:hypothetical protein